MSEIREWVADIWGEGCNKYCEICFEIMTDIGDVSLDHKTPTSRNGKPGLENCHLVHKECNQIKGDFTLEEIRYLLECVNPDALAILKNRLKRSTLIYGRKY